MKKILLTIAILWPAGGALYAWWDAGHLITAMIAYQNLDAPVRARVDALTLELQRDYPFVNHFIATGPWPDDLKADGVRAYDTWHYTNIPYNRDGVALPPRPEVDIIWAVNQSMAVLRAEKAQDAEKARFLAFLVHFVSDLHQPLHSTSMFTHEQPGGNAGGNGFALQGNWRNLHALWDDGCGYTSPLNDINPYGQEKKSLTSEDIARISAFADELMREFPPASLPAVNNLDPDFWALESHKLAMQYAYRAVNDPGATGRSRYLAPNDTPSDYYLEQAQPIVRRQLALSGYRLAGLLNEWLKE